jgi:transcriptional regulator with XRE-family HTH domain
MTPHQTQILIGNRIKSALARAKITRRAAATAIGVSPTSVQNWASGRVPLNVIELLALCKLTDISPDWILGWETEDREHLRTAIIAAVETALMMRDRH